MLVSDAAATLVARSVQGLYYDYRRALKGASARAGRYLQYHFRHLLRGQEQKEKLLRVTFNNVGDSESRVLRRKLARMETVQRFFRRSFASGVLKVDVMLRLSRGEFDREFSHASFDGFWLEPGGPSIGEGVVYTVRSSKKPAE